MLWRPIIRLPLAVVLAVATLAAAACDRGDPGQGDDVVFGQGSVPASFPRDFPIPADAVIGTTLVDRINNRTEVNLTMGTDLASAVRFFNVGLVSQGYVVDRSEGDGSRWSIEFLRGELRGEVDLSVSGTAVLISIVVNTS